MNSIIIFDAFGDIYDEYILTAQKRMGWFFDTPAAQKGVRFRRRAVIYIAAAIVMLLASFSVAMAVNADFREFVLSVFNIGITEMPPQGVTEAPPEGEIRQIGGEVMDESVSTYYFRGSGVIVPDDGLLYAGEYGGGSFCDLSGGGLTPLATSHVVFPYSFRGTDFNISFDYTVYDGVAHFHALPEKLDENPYKYAWSVRRTGDTDTALLLLPYETQNDYGVYPLVLSLRTLEMSDPVDRFDLDGIVPYNWRFSDDMTFAVLYGCRYGIEDHWLCDLEKQTLKSLSELTGGSVTDSYILDAHHVICYVAGDGVFDVVSLDPTAGAAVKLAEGVKRYGQTDDKSGFRNIEYYGGYGRHAMLFDGAGGVTLIDLLTGRRTPLEGITDDGSLLTSESPDGKHIMTAFRDTTVPKSMSMYKIGVLDTETGVLKLMERTNYQVRSEMPLGWLANDCVAVIAFDGGAESGWYLYAYDFRADQYMPPRTFAEPKDDEPVRVTDYIPDIYVELKYSTTDNFTGQVIYDFTDAYLRYGTVKKLADAQRELAEKGYSLKIWDAYRPVSAQFRLWEVCPDPVYVANPYAGYSGHSKGSTVDLTLVRSDGSEITMPTGFDNFSEKADRDYSDVPDEAAANARFLENTMLAHGFSCYFGEWWHFSDSTDYPILDFTPPARPAGDIDGDGEITNVDVVTLARYIAGLCSELTASAVRSCADMNDDGEITNIDLVTLARVCVQLE